MPDPTPAVVVLIGNPRSGSRTSAIATAVADAIRSEADGLDGRTIELADAIAISLDGRTAQPVAPQADLIDAIRTARLLVVATPSYKGTYTGLLKLVFDQLPHRSLDGITAVPVAVAGAPAHLRTTSADLTRLLTELGATVTATVEVLEAELDSASAQIARAARRAAGHALAVSPTS